MPRDGWQYGGEAALDLYCPMKISFDPAKRHATLQDRGLDFDDAIEVFSGKTLDYEDRRFDYPEPE
jgi:uncharacterized DUF497 family protein